MAQQGEGNSSTQYALCHDKIQYSHHRKCHHQAVDPNPHRYGIIVARPHYPLYVQSYHHHRKPPSTPSETACNACVIL